MARSRSSGGGTGVASVWALVIFGLGFGVCLVISVYLYTQLTTARQEAAQADDELRQYVSSSEASTPRVADLREQASQAGATLLGHLMETNSQLRALLVAEREAELQTIQNRIDSLSEQSDLIEPPVVGAMEDLVNEVQSQSDRIAQLQANLEDAQDQALAAQREKEQLGQRFQEAQQTLQQRLDEATTGFRSYESRVEQTESELTQRVQEVHSAREDRIVELENEVRERQQQINTLQNRLAELKNEMKGIAPPDVIQADGRIASVVQNDHMVYIDLGRRDHVVLGMTFEVFPSGELVRPDEFDQVRGKATIEVIEIQDESALARIVREDTQSSGPAVEEGDQVINLAYSPDAVYTFHVHGRFNISGTGEPTTADARRIESIVRRWGGELAEELNYDVDFLVVGEAPELPGQLPEGTIDPAEIRAHAESQREYERYQELIGTAEARNIPVINQNRFLALVGYYER